MRASVPFRDRGISMNDPTHALPAESDPSWPEPRAYDPLAVALGNASLLGVGYLMLRRRGLAAAALTVTFVLVVRLVSTASPSYEVVALLWWTAVTAHGWFLARRSAGGRGARRLGQRLVALGVTVPVVLSVAYLRFDAAEIQRSVTEAREDGDCEAVAAAQSRVGAGHRLADAPLSAAGDEAVRTCDRLRLAAVELDIALVGDIPALRRGFRTLDSILEKPGNTRTVQATLDEFLGDLPTADSCATVAAVDWLRGRNLGDDLLDRTAARAERATPASLVGCGDDLMDEGRWKDARARYERLLDQYPDDDLAGEAEKGITKATQSIELDHVRGLLAPGAGAQPEYCSKPAKYSGAKPLRKGVNPALYFGDDAYSGQLPDSWAADGATDAVLIVCVDDAAYGDVVRTCPYERDSGAVTQVSFHKIAISAKVYELRTGKRVADREIQIGGSSCPALITYTSYGGHDPGPPPDDYVEPSKSDIRKAFRPLVAR